MNESKELFQINNILQGFHKVLHLGHYFFLICIKDWSGDLASNPELFPDDKSLFSVVEAMTSGLLGHLNAKWTLIQIQLSRHKALCLVENRNYNRMEYAWFRYSKLWNP